MVRSVILVLRFPASGTLLLAGKTLGKVLKTVFRLSFTASPSSQTAVPGRSGSFPSVWFLRCSKLDFLNAARLIQAFRVLFTASSMSRVRFPMSTTRLKLGIWFSWCEK
jgi:hypothetical protein